MTIANQIHNYLQSLPEPKQSEMLMLHHHILALAPSSTLWYLDGINAEGKTVANPNIGYGTYTIQYANGTSKVFYQIGISANTTGISVYILGLHDKTYLSKTFANTIGKATITGYCIKFKTINDINLAVLEAAIQYGLAYQ
jgi:hypothetical protein